MTATRSSVDVGRSHIYAAEHMYSRLCARANTVDGKATVDIAGRTVTLPAERHFGQLADVDRYIRAVLAADPDTAGIPAPTVRARRGELRAHWKAGVIALPDTGFGRSEHTVLHELAHHVAAAKGVGHPGHGPGWRYWLCRLHTAATGPEGGWALGVLIDQAVTGEHR